MDGPGLVARLYDFVWALLSYWWLLVPGGIFAVEPLIEGLAPSTWKSAIDKQWPKEKRHKLFRWGSTIALLFAGFLAFDDVNTRNRSLQRELTAALQRTASPTQQSTIDRLSGDLVAARGEIDRQSKFIERQEQEIDAQNKQIAALQPRPDRHLNEDDKRRLEAAFFPLKDQFSTLRIGAPGNGEPQGYAAEFLQEFNSVGILVPRVEFLIATSAQQAALQVVVKNVSKIPPKAELFAETMKAAGFQVVGGKMDTLGDDQFMFVVGENH